MTKLIQNLQIPDNILILDHRVTHKISKGNEDFIKKNITYSRFIGKSLVLCSVYISDMQWVLISFDQENQRTSILNRLPQLTDEQWRAIKTLNTNLHSFYRNEIKWEPI